MRDTAVIADAPIHLLPLTPDLIATAQGQGFSTFAPRVSPPGEERAPGKKRRKGAPEGA